MSITSRPQYIQNASMSYLAKLGPKLLYISQKAGQIPVCNGNGTKFNLQISESLNT